jgi:hypothetical protein
MKVKELIFLPVKGRQIRSIKPNEMMVSRFSLFCKSGLSGVVGRHGTLAWWYTKSNAEMAPDFLKN